MQSPVTKTLSTLSAGSLTVTHNLGVRYPTVVVADNNNLKIGGVDNVTYTSTTALSLDAKTERFGFYIIKL
jgi:hypothetical protein